MQTEPTKSNSSGPRKTWSVGCGCNYWLLLPELWLLPVSGLMLLVLVLLEPLEPELDPPGLELAPLLPELVLLLVFTFEPDWLGFVPMLPLVPSEPVP